MKRTMLSAIGIGMLAATASPALASEITALTIDPMGTLIPGHTGVTITGSVVCDVTGTVFLEFVEVTQTKKKTQFGFASTFPDVGIPCGPFVTQWTATAVISFNGSALLHKGKSGVQVNFADTFDDNHLVTAFVFLQ